MNKRSNPVAIITESVGKGGKNNPADVGTIQAALNFSEFVTEKLTVDRRYGPKTFNAILQYQMSIFNHQNACDGRIDPHGRTLQCLNNPRLTIGRQVVPMASVLAMAHSLGGHKGTPSVEQLVSDPRIRAMLDVLGFTEGTGNNYGKVADGVVLKSSFYPELVGKRNVSVNDLARHPEILVKVNSVIESTAAGRYQFLKRTWDEMKMPDFSANSQDLAAVKLMQRRGMIEPLLAGNIDEAVYKGAPEWASLPKPDNSGFYKDQKARPIDKIRKVYQGALSKYQTSSKTR